MPHSVPEMPTYNYYALLSEEAYTRHDTRGWTDFLRPPEAPTTTAALLQQPPPKPLHDPGPVVPPLRAMENLRADLSACCRDIADMAPTGSYDVRGWLPSTHHLAEVNLAVGTWNINGLDSYKLSHVVMLMRQDHIDIMLCTDTRHSDITAKAYRKRLRQELGAGVECYFSKDSKRNPGEPGGIVMIIGPR